MSNFCDTNGPFCDNIYTSSLLISVKIPRWSCTFPNYFGPFNSTWRRLLLMYLPYTGYVSKRRRNSLNQISLSYRCREWLICLQMSLKKSIENSETSLFTCPDWEVSHSVRGQKEKRIVCATGIPKELHWHNKENSGNMADYELICQNQCHQEG